MLGVGFSIPELAVRGGGAFSPTPESPAFRYWRVFVQTASGGSPLAIQEIQMRESTYGPDVCIGGVAAVSSSFNVDYPASNAFDDLLEDDAVAGAVRLWAASTSTNEWVSYDFGAGNEKSIEAIDLWSRNAPFTDQSPKDFLVQYSADNLVWTTKWAVTNQTSWLRWDHRKFVNPTYDEAGYSGSPHGAHRYWRVWILDIEKSSGFTAPVVAEMEMRATPSGADQTGTGTPSARASYQTEVAANAFDNNAGTNYSSPDNGNFDRFPEWLEYDFGTPVALAELSIQNWTIAGGLDRAPERCVVAYSDDATNYTPAWNIAGQTGWASGEVRVFTDPGYV